MENDDIKVINNAAANRFEATIEGHRAEATYELRDGTLTLTHTHVPPELSGRGIAGHLAQAAFDYARKERLKVVPRCPYMAGWAKKHDEFADLVVPS